jgi:hypothetical protein
MGYIWVIYGLYMGYPRELAMVADLHGFYTIPYLLSFDNEHALHKKMDLYKPFKATYHGSGYLLNYAGADSPAK